MLLNKEVEQRDKRFIEEYMDIKRKLLNENTIYFISN